MKLAKKPSSTPRTPAGKANKSKTPKGKSTPITPAKNGQGIRLGAADGEELEKSEVVPVLSSLRKTVKADDQKLFSDEGQRVNLQVTGIKLPKDDRQHVLKMVLPNPYLVEPSEVCVFVKDGEKGIKADHEPTVQKFKELFADKGVEQIAEIIPLRQLKVEYKTFEAKAKLCNRFDKFLADDRIVRLLPKFLGKQFYQKKRFPVQVNLRASDLNAEVSKAIRTTQLPLSHHGTCAMVTVGHTQMTDSRLAENIVAASKVLSRRYPGGWRNIRSLMVKAEKSMSLPLHVSSLSANDVGFVDADIPSKVRRQAVSGELSTQPGMEVVVLPGGEVKIKKVGDPEWDDEKDEPFMEGSDEEAEEDEDDEEKKDQEGEEGKKAPKRKAEKEKEDAKGKKKRKKKEVDSEDSEDEEIDRAEMKYLSKAQQDPEAKEESAEEEEEQNEEGDSDAEEESGEEEGSDDDEEGDGESDSEDEAMGDEEEESDYDDDQELDSDDVVVDSDDDEEESDGDDDEKLMLKKKAGSEEEEEDDDSD